MKFNVDLNYLLDVFKDIISVPSPVGYSVKMKPAIEKIASELGHTVTYDNNNTAYITLEGEDTSKTVLISAHLDTLGLMVRKIYTNKNKGERKWIQT